MTADLSVQGPVRRNVARIVRISLMRVLAVALAGGATAAQSTVIELPAAPFDSTGLGDAMPDARNTADLEISPEPAAPESESGTAASTFPWKWNKKKVLGLGWHSASAVDAQGHQHVVFSTGQEAAINLLHAWFDGATWFSETVDTGIGSYSVIAAVMDAQGNLHVAYGKDIGAWPDNVRHLQYAHNDSGAWEVETVEVGGDSPAIAIAADDVVHILHVRRSDLPGNDDDLRYLEQTPGSWAAEIVDTAVDADARNSLLLRDGNVYAAYNSRYPQELHFATRSRGAWTLDDVDAGSNGSLTFDSDETPHIVYNSPAIGSPTNDMELRHAWHMEAGWQHEVLVTPSSIFGSAVKSPLHAYTFAPDTVVDFAGRLQLAFGFFVAKAEASVGALMVASLQDGVWIPQVIGPKDSGLFTDMAVSPSGIVHIATSRLPKSGVFSVMAVTQKGKKLSLAVVPPESGVITDALTGMTCSNKLSERIYPGTEVTLSAAAAPGFTFVGWAKAASGSDATCSVTLDHGRKVVARFEPLP